jgi:hypothetical protein
MPLFRHWLAVALLAASWVMGTGYLLPVHVLSWLGVVVAGVLLLASGDWRMPGRRELWVSLALLAVPLLWSWWPVRMAALLLAVGISAEMIFRHWDWPRKIGRGAFAAGAIMLAQWPAMVLYMHHTARGHLLPPPLPWLMAGVLRLLGVDAAADGGTIAFNATREPMRLQATWETLLDPATFCFFCGGLVLLGLVGYARLPHGTRTRAWVAAVRWLALGLVVWLPLRFGLLATLLVHRAVRATWQWDLNAMDQMLSPWVLLVMLAPLALLCWRLTSMGKCYSSSTAAAPEGADPDSATPNSADPNSADPNSADPNSADPNSADPNSADPSSADPNSADPNNTDPNDADPNNTDPNETAGGLCRIDQAAAVDVPRGRRYIGALALAALAAVLATLAVRWVAVGGEKGGRVMFVERHSRWEPTQRDYDTDWYGEPSGYNYAGVYRYLEQFYQMSQLMPDEKIDAETLDRCDVLIIKIPTSRYAPEEVDAVEEFVHRGGSLLLVGEHTNVFRSGTFVNDIARRFGFTFRHDLLFDMDTAYIQDFRPPWVPHPAVANMPPMQFAVSGSIDPGYSIGRPVIQAGGLWSLPSDYNVGNYFPVPRHRTDMQYGAFIEAWATTSGGRVMAFGDSTIWSNFTTFEPGKTEMLRGMVNWLNRGSALDSPWLSLSLRGLLLIGAVAAGVVASLMLWGYCDAWLTVIAAGAAGWTLASLAVIGYTHAAMSLPTPRDDVELRHVVVDRELSDAPLGITGFPSDDGQGFVILEQWIPRVGVHSRRESGREVFSGDALVVINPSGSVPPWYSEGLKRYVAEGGNLLVIDSPGNTRSTANSLLWPFGLSLVPGQAWQGTLMIDGQWPGFKIDQALEVTGGEPLATLGGQRAVAAMTEYGEGKGRVIAVGFGPALNDEKMNVSWDREPDASMRTRYEVLFQIARLLVDGTPLKRPAE